MPAEESTGRTTVRQKFWLTRRKADVDGRFDPLFLNLLLTVIKCIMSPEFSFDDFQKDKN